MSAEPAATAATPAAARAGHRRPPSRPASPAAFSVALDWGTTNLRAFLLDSDGKVVAQRDRPWGILALPAAADAGGFDRALEGIAADWLAARPGARLIASGMVGSAQGWLEAPYLACPAGAADLAGQLTAVATARAGELLIVPGLLLNQPDGLPDVIRGEETQVVGAFETVATADGAVCFVLPGTHSKWVLLQDRRIVRFATYMTGELFATLKRHSILGRLMRDPAGESGAGETAAAWHQGLALARESGPGDLMRHLFTVRSMGLAGRLPATALSDYLSGLLIGHEIASATAWLRRHAAAGTPLTLIGEADLLERYRAAFAAFELHSEAIGNTAAAGLYRLITLAGIR